MLEGLLSCGSALELILDHSLRPCIGRRRRSGPNVETLCIDCGRSVACCLLTVDLGLSCFKDEIDKVALFRW